VREEHIQQQQERDGEKLSLSATDGNSKETTTIETTTRPSGDSPGGFVVYNQTVELVSMLNRQVASIFDD
jgi:hypothetical protein